MDLSDFDNNRQSYSCVKCSAILHSSNELLEHISVRHLGWLPFGCIYCGSVFGTKETVFAHIDLSHVGKRRKYVNEEDEGKSLKLEQMFKASTQIPAAGLGTNATSISSSLTSADIDDIANTTAAAIIQSQSPICANLVASFAEETTDDDENHPSKSEMETRSSPDPADNSESQFQRLPDDQLRRDNSNAENHAAKSSAFDAGTAEPDLTSAGSVVKAVGAQKLEDSRDKQQLDEPPLLWPSDTLIDFRQISSRFLEQNTVDLMPKLLNNSVTSSLSSVTNGGCGTFPSTVKTAKKEDSSGSGSKSNVMRSSGSPRPVPVVRSMIVRGATARYAGRPISLQPRLLTAAPSTTALRQRFNLQPSFTTARVRVPRPIFPLLDHNTMCRPPPSLPAQSAQPPQLTPMMSLTPSTFPPISRPSDAPPSIVVANLGQMPLRTLPPQLASRAATSGEHRYSGRFSSFSLPVTVVPKVYTPPPNGDRELRSMESKHGEQRTAGAQPIFTLSRPLYAINQLPNGAMAADMLPPNTGAPDIKVNAATKIKAEPEETILKSMGFNPPSDNRQPLLQFIPSTSVALKSSSKVDLKSSALGDVPNSDSSKQDNNNQPQEMKKLRGGMRQKKNALNPPAHEQRRVRTVRRAVKNYQCVDCREVIPRSRTLMHVALRHLPEYPVQCGYCPYGYLDVSNVTAHVRNCHPLRPIKLTDNRSKYEGTLLALRSRLLIEYDDGRKRPSVDTKPNSDVNAVECKLCGEKTNKLRLHAASVHLDVSLFECRLCSFGSANLLHMQQHFKHEHVDSINTTEKPDALLIDNRRKYQQRIENLKSACFGVKSDINASLSSVADDVKTGETKISKLNVSKSSTRATKKLETQLGAASVGAVRKDRGQVYGRVKCTGCGHLIVSRTDALVYHIRTFHLNKRTYRCSACDFQAERHAAVLNHVSREHAESGTKTHIIDNRRDVPMTLEIRKLFRQFFAKRVSWKRGLRRAKFVLGMDESCGPEVKKETNPLKTDGERPLDGTGSVECPACRVVLSKRLECLRIHICGSHLPEKPLQCPHCPYASGSSSQLVWNHVVNKHPGLYPEYIDKRREYRFTIAKLLKDLFGVGHNGLGRPRSVPTKMKPEEYGNGKDLRPVARKNQSQTVRSAEEKIVSNVVRYIRCGGCDESVRNSRFRIRNHVTECHLPPVTTACPRCEFSTDKGDDALSDHLRLQHAEVAHEISVQSDRTVDETEKLVDHFIEKYFHLPPGQLRVENDVPLIKCAKCRKMVTNTDYGMEQHIKLKHINGSIRRCPYCNDRRVTKLLHHIKKVHPNKPITSVYGRKEITEHIDRLRKKFFGRRENDDGALLSGDELDDDKLICAGCHKSVSKSNTQNHVFGAHMTEQPFGCVYCDYGSPSNFNVRRHIRLFHPNKPVKLDNRKARLTDTMRMLRLRLFPAFSGNCNENVRTTVTNMPATVVKEEIPASSSNDVFSDAVVTNTEPEPNTSSTRRLLCSGCHRMVPRRNRFSHIYSTHMTDLPFGCAYCTYESITTFNVKRHIRQHHADKEISILNKKDQLQQIIRLLRNRFFQSENTQIKRHVKRIAEKTERTQAATPEAVSDDSDIEESDDNDDEHDRSFDSLRAQSPPAADVPSLQCVECGMTVVRQAGSITHHVKERHLTEKLLQCARCHFSANNMYLMKLHNLQRHTDEPPQIIDKRNNYDSLIQDKVKLCFPQCDLDDIKLEPIIVRSNRGKTVQKHSSKDRVKCGACGSRIVNDRDLALGHIKQHHLPEHLLYCLLCPTAVEHDEQLTTVENSSDGYRGFSRIARLREHLTRFHNGQVPKIIDNRQKYVNLTEQKLKEYFPTVRRNNTNVQRKRRGAHAHSAAQQNRKIGAASTGNFVVCAKCKMVVSQVATNMRLHVKQHHLREKLYQCNLCGSEYSQLAVMKRHFDRLHAGSEFDIVNRAPDFLGAIFKMMSECFPSRNESDDTKVEQQNADDLWTQTSVVPKRSAEVLNGDATTSECRQCGMQVVQRPSNLRLHVRSFHLPEKPYRCAVCASVGRYYGGCKRLRFRNHFARRHPGLPVEVIDISEKYRQTINQLSAEYFPDHFTKPNTQEETPGCGIKPAGGDTRCQKCGVAVASKLFNIRHHVLKCHLPEKLLLCRLCPSSEPYATNRPFIMRFHHLMSHPEQQMDIIDRTKQRKQQIDEMVRNYFFVKRASSLQDSSTTIEWHSSRMINSSFNEHLVEIAEPNDPVVQVECRLCSVSVASDANKLSFHMLSQHLPEKLFYCNVCPPQLFGFTRLSGAMRHYRAHHRNATFDVIDNRTKYSKLIPEIGLKCFPDCEFVPKSWRRFEDADVTAEERVNCEGCGRTVSQLEEEPRLHVLRHHLPDKLFYCRHCPKNECGEPSFGANDLSEMLSHHHQCHPETEISYVDNNAEYTPVIEQMLKECFPTELPATNVMRRSVPMRKMKRRPDQASITCRECGARLAHALASARSHVKHCHLPGHLFSCQLPMNDNLICGFGSAKREYVFRHCLLEHPNDEPKILDEQSKYLPMIQQKFKDCFPTFAWRTRKRDRISKWIYHGSKSEEIKDKINRFGSQMCKLCNKIVPKTSSSRHYHAVEYHMDEKPHKCCACGYESFLSNGMIYHVDRVHRGENVEFSRHIDGDYWDRVRAKLAECFDVIVNPDRKPTMKKLRRTPEGRLKGPTVSKRLRAEMLQSGCYRCPECNAAISKQRSENRRLHVIYHHLPEKLLQCMHCDFSTCAHSRMSLHFERSHEGIPKAYVNNLNKYRKLVEEKLRKINEYNGIKRISGRSANKNRRFDQWPAAAGSVESLGRKRTTAETMVQCRRCAATIDVRSAVYHAENAHRQQEADVRRSAVWLYRCSDQRCQFRNNNEDAAVQHLVDVHRDNDAELIKSIDRWGLKGERQALLQEFFGIKRPGLGYVNRRRKRRGGVKLDAEIEEQLKQKPPSSSVTTTSACCTICGELPIESGTTPSLHVYYRHFKAARYQCRFCDYGCHTNDQPMLLHMARKHPEEARRDYVDRWPTIHPQFEALVASCFPSADTSAKSSVDGDTAASLEPKFETFEPHIDVVTTDDEISFDASLNRDSPVADASIVGIVGVDVTSVGSNVSMLDYPSTSNIDPIESPKDVKREEVDRKEERSHLKTTMGKARGRPFSEKTSKPNAKDRLLRCTLCSQDIRSAAKRYHVIRDHLERIWLYVCPYCDNYGNEQKIVIQTHVARMHPEQKFEIIDNMAMYLLTIRSKLAECFGHVDGEPYPCIKCYRRGGGTRGRKPLAEKEEPKYNPPSSDVQTSNIVYCTNCHFKAPNKYGIKEYHVLTEHMKTKPFKCSFCPYETVLARDMLKHTRLYHRTDENLAEFVRESDEKYWLEVQTKIVECFEIEDSQAKREEPASGHGDKLTKQQKALRRSQRQLFARVAKLSSTGDGSITKTDEDSFTADDFHIAMVSDDRSPCQSSTVRTRRTLTHGTVDDTKEDPDTSANDSLDQVDVKEEIDEHIRTVGDRQCRLCGRRNLRVTQKWSHVVTQHLAEKDRIYICSLCPAFGSKDVGLVKEHGFRKHFGVEFDVIDQRPLYRPKIRELLRECFAN